MFKAVYLWCMRNAQLYFSDNSKIVNKIYFGEIRPYKLQEFWSELRLEIAILLYGHDTCCTEACLLILW